MIKLEVIIREHKRMESLSRNGLIKTNDFNSWLEEVILLCPKYGVYLKTGKRDF